MKASGAPAAGSGSSSSAANDQPQGTFVFWACLSICSSVGIILVNKTIMSKFHFNYVFTLTTLHFVAQAIVMEICVWMGIIKAGKLPMKDNILTAACGVASIAFMNYNLQFNSVGFYQMTKLMCIPLMVFIQSSYYGKTYSGKIKFSLCLVLLGVGITGVSDIQVNFLGLIFGTLAVLSTTQFQIWQGAKKDQHKVTPIQITHSVSFPLAIICGLCAIFIEGFTISEDDVSVFDHEFSGFAEIGYIGLSCMFAISVNICSFTLIGNSSAVTYQVIGHLKTVLVLLGGFALFGFNGTTFQLLYNLSGIAVAMVGVVLYGHLGSIGAGGTDVLSAYCPFWFTRVLHRFDATAERQYELVDNPNNRKAGKGDDKA
jgi:solute carrier family 35 protein E3